MVNLPTNERRLVESAIDRWCGHLSTGSLMTVDGRLLRVSLAAQPPALVVEQRGTFTLASMEHMDLRKACWSGHECLLSFAAPRADASGKWPQVLRFTFPQHDECAEFALAVRALQRLAPDVQDAVLVREPTGGSNSNRSNVSSVRSGSSGVSGDRRGSGRLGKRNRRSSKQRPVLLTGAADSRLAALAVEGVHLPSRAEVQTILGDEAAPKPLDSPSAKTMKPSLPEFMRLHSNNPPILAGPEEEEEEGCPIPSAADSPSARKFKGALAESLRGAAHDDHAEPLEPHLVDGLRKITCNHSVVPTASASALAAQRTRDRLPPAVDEPPQPLGHKFQSEPLLGLGAQAQPLEPLAVVHVAAGLPQGLLPPKDAAEPSTEQHAASSQGLSWQQYHQFRRARLAAILGPLPQSDPVSAGPELLAGQRPVFCQ